MPSSINVTSPQESFTPRKEFVRQTKSTKNTFSLLALSGAQFVRLYSFSPVVVAALRHFFEQYHLIVGYREDTDQNLCELSLQGRPWSNPKTVNSERLLVEMLAIFYTHGYTYLSTIDYGREHDDRLAVTFKKPVTMYNLNAGSSRTASEGPSSHSQSDIDSSKRIPFALSFPSATLLRVICPPLHLTPAILQGVRGSWPRGVVSEKKVGDSAYEFKLKGYNWFQEDTFASDSLNHILTLLSSLDAHSFSLLTSISLTNSRSRVKDLWIFTGPSPSSTEAPIFPNSPAPSITSSPKLDARYHGSESPPHYSPQTLHQRMATAPTSSSSSVPRAQVHQRAATDGHSPRPFTPSQTTSPLASSPVKSPLSPNAGLLRKPAPRAQIPVSVVPEDSESVATETLNNPVTQEEPPLLHRENQPGVLHSDGENMAHLDSVSPAKTPDVFYSTSPFTQASEQAAPHGEQIMVAPAAPGADVVQNNASQSSTPSLHHSASRSPSPRSPYSNHTPPPLLAQPSNELLSPAAFRDSVFSANSADRDSSIEVGTPVKIKWTGQQAAALGNEHEMLAAPQPVRPENERLSTSPMLPGGWAPTPLDERPEFYQQQQSTADNAGPGGESQVQQPNGEGTTPVHELREHVQSPNMRISAENEATGRKSEAGLIEMAASTPPPMPTSKPQGPNPADKKASGEGWVLVDVEGTGAEGGNDKLQTSGPASSPSSSTPDIDPHATMSPAAKTIVIIDAMENKRKENGGGMPDSTMGSRSPSSPSPSGVRRLFSISKKPSIKENEVDSSTSKRPSGKGAGFRSRLRRIGNGGPPEAERKEDKRRSFN